MGFSSCVVNCLRGVFSTSFRESPALRFHFCLRYWSSPSYCSQVPTVRTSTDWRDLWRAPQWLCQETFLVWSWYEQRNRSIVKQENSLYEVLLNVWLRHIFLLKKIPIHWLCGETKCLCDVSEKAFLYFYHPTIFPKLFWINQCGNCRNHSLHSLVSQCHGWIQRMNLSKSMELPWKLICLG